jgi:hypothetical protein
MPRLLLVYVTIDNDQRFYQEERLEQWFRMPHRVGGSSRDQGGLIIASHASKARQRDDHEESHEGGGPVGLQSK